MDIVESCRAFLAGQLSNDALCRAVVRHPTWHLLVNDQNGPWAWETAGAKVVVALTEKRSLNGIDAKATVLSGRELVRMIGDDAQGIAFELGSDHAVAFSRTQIDNDLRHYATAIDCEAALQSPKESAAHHFVSHTWLLLMDGDQPFTDESSGRALAYAFTARDAAEAWRRERPLRDAFTLARMRGTEIFATIAAMAEVDGLQVNPEFQIFPPLSLFVANALANGVDQRFDSRVLPAQTIAEIYAFLEQMEVYRASIEHEMVYRDDILVARYRGVAAEGRLVSFDFTPIEPTDDPLHIGVHKSEILCPGWLVSKLIDLLQVLPHDPAELTESDVELLHNGMRWIAQLWAQLDGRPAIPRIELRTVEGAAAVRKHPEIVTQDYIDRAFSRLVDLEREREMPTP